MAIIECIRTITDFSVGRVGPAELPGMDGVHEQIARLGTIQLLKKQRILTTMKSLACEIIWVAMEA
jgi:hypothetical protein